MSEYVPNPKTAGSGVVCAVPQKGRCPYRCADCFFQSGRSYLEPLDERTPNMPPPEVVARAAVVRVNDGNDSSNQLEEVVRATAGMPRRFFNTSWPDRVAEFPGPVVLTINPGELTDVSLWKLGPHVPRNLMFVRFRTDTWNLDLADAAVEYYATREVPVVLTFMAYHSVDSIPQERRGDYVLRRRTTNEYWAITTDAWRAIVSRYLESKWVSWCGRVEGERGDTHCRHCGNCLKEYFATMERLWS